VQIPSVPLNFGFCENPELRQDKPWNLKILFAAFDIRIWIALILLMFCLSFLAVFIHKLSPSTAILSVLSGLISTVPDITGAKRLKTWWLFILWMMVCVVLVNYYCGLTTSMFISPPLEDVIIKVSQLLEAGYHLIFEDFYHLWYVGVAVRHHLQNTSG